MEHGLTLSMSFARLLGWECNGLLALQQCATSMQALAEILHRKEPSRTPVSGGPDCLVGPD